MGNLLVENIGRLVLMEGDPGVLCNACLLIIDGVIVWFGRSGDQPSIAEMADVERFDAQGRVVTPGLVDCHTHTVFGGDRREEFALRSSGTSYEDIAAAGGGIQSTMRRTRGESLDALVESAAKRLAEMQRRGVTTVEIKSGYGLDLASELKMLEAVDRLRSNQPLRIEATFLGAHTRPPEFISIEKYANYIIDVMLPAVADQGIARFCDVFCERNVFDVDAARRILTAARNLGLIPKVHAEQLSWQGGTALGAELGAASVDHLEWITSSDIDALEDSDTVAVVLPGAGVMLDVPHHAPARALLDAGVKVAIATDCNPGSSMCVDLPLMTTLATTLLGMTPGEAMKGVTIHGADALRRSDLGRITEGSKGDVVVWDTTHEDNIPYRFGAVSPVLVAVNGEVVS